MQDAATFLPYTGAANLRSYVWQKRAIDIIIATLALILVCPLLICCCLAIKGTSPGPVFVRIRRVGQNGKPFAMLKLRTMVVDADERLKAWLEASPEAAAEWARGFKLKSDPRIIGTVGSLLRRTSIDELPQLLNVVMGTMSIVGPRPFPDYHLSSFSQEFRTLRQAVKPGITGLWQVDRAPIPSLSDQERLDRRYIERRCLFFDLYVLARTFGALRRGAGAY